MSAEPVPGTAEGDASHAAYLLRRIAEEAERAAACPDARERARVLAEVIQPYAGWALREAVLDLRDERGMGWSSLADVVGLAPGVVARQARGLGPVVTIAPSYDTGSESEVPTPLRLAAAALQRCVTELAAAEPDSPLVPLYVPVQALAAAPGGPVPAVVTAGKVLEAADAVGTELGPGWQPSDKERAVLAAVAELRTVHGRGHGAVRRDRAPRPAGGGRHAGRSASGE